jgi:hypothetical protein
VESSSDHEEEVPDPKLDQTENELKKISTGMANVFLAELAVERQRRKSAKSSRHIDPRSAARCPAANREPHFKLRLVFLNFPPFSTGYAAVCLLLSSADYSRPF